MNNINKSCKDCGTTTNLRISPNHGKMVTYNICNDCFSKKLSIARLGKKKNYSEKTRKKMAKLTSIRMKKYYSKKENREAQSKRISNYFSKLSKEERSQICSWNKGLNKENSEYIREISKKISASNMGRKCSESTKKLISEKNKGKKLSNKTKLKISEVQKGKHHSIKSEFKKGNIPWNKGLIIKNIPKYKKSIEQTRQKKLGVKQPIEVVIKRMISTSKHFSSNYMTVPEKEVHKILKTYQGWKFVGKGDFWIRNRNPDFINFDKKKIIEVFGDYWHDDNRKNIHYHQTEKGRIEFFKEHGWDTLIIWEHEIKNDVSEVNNKINIFDGDNSEV